MLYCKKTKIKTHFKFDKDNEDEKDNAEEGSLDMIWMIKIIINSSPERCDINNQQHHILSIEPHFSYHSHFNRTYLLARSNYHHRLTNHTPFYCVRFISTLMVWICLLDIYGTLLWNVKLCGQYWSDVQKRDIL